MSKTYYQMFIGGQWVDAVDSRRFSVTNPATGEDIATVPDADTEDINKAIESAEAAFKTWSEKPAEVRARYMRRIADLLVEHADEAARLLTLEQGKPIREARDEVLSGAEYVRWYAEEARRVYGETIPASSANSRAWVLRRPIGVVGAITPWNFPSAMVTRKIAPAIAAGCTVILKPAEQTPLSALIIAEVLEKADLPPGVVNIVTTSRPELVGEAFMNSPIVRKISFTGSTEVGKHLFRGAAGHVKRLSLELGGHAPFIVFEDADLKAAVRRCIAAKFRNAGQTCVSVNRLYVQESVAGAFTEMLTKAVSRLKPAPGFEPEADLGPLIDASACRKVEQHIADAVGKGARIVTGGYRLTGGHFNNGFFFSPTVLTDVTEDMTIAREETFGPVLPIMTFRTEDEVVRRANATPYGLAAYVFTSALARTIRVAERLEYGMVAINEAALAGPQLPFGGIKESGQGREGGWHGMDEYLDYRLVSVDLGE